MMQVRTSPPPLSLPLSSHPRYPDIIKIGEASGTILDVGAGLGKETIQLLKDGAVSVCAMDREPQYAPLIAQACIREGVAPERCSFVSGDVLSLLSPPASQAIKPEDDLQAWRATHAGTFSVVICNRVLPLLPDSPYQSAPLLSALLSLLTPPKRDKPSMMVGLQRGLPSDMPSSWRSVSNAPTASETARHWLWAHDEWEKLLEGVCAKERSIRSGCDLTWGSEFLEAEEGRGAERWWTKVGCT